MKKIILLAAVLLAVSSACAMISIKKPDGTEITVRAFGVDPKVRKLQTANVLIEDGEYSSEPGVRMWEMTLDKLYQAGMAAAGAGATGVAAPVLPPLSE